MPEENPDAAKYLAGNALVCADNIDVMRVLPDECVDLIYLDPPFNSNHNYVAVFGDKGRVDAQLRDIWRWTVETENAYRRLQRGPLLNAIDGIRLITGEQSKMAAYAVFIGRRLAEMRRALKNTGTLYLHCNPAANVYLRILLDATFGEANFIDEIIWNYGTASGGRAAGNKYVKTHETLLVYARKKGDHTYHKAFLPYSEKYIRERFVHVDKDERKYRTRERNGQTTRQYLDASPGVPLSTVWSDIRQLYAYHWKLRKEEEIGYSTQKPLALLERLLGVSSNEGDFVLDPFCGCGTAADAAAKLGRKYLGIDISGIAVRVMEQRLTSRGSDVAPVVYGLGWSDYEWEQFEKRALQSRDDTEDGIPGWAWAEDKVAGLLNAVPNSRKTGDGGVDARFYGAAREIIPIQVKMHRNRIGRPDMDKLLGAQTAMQNRGIFAPMSLMVSLYPPANNLRTFAAEQGRVTLDAGADGVSDYPVMQVLSVQEMLTKGELPKLPPPDPRSLVGNSQTRLVIS